MDNIDNKVKKQFLVKNIMIVNDRGLHARASAKFVTMANRMPKKLNIYVAKNDQRVVGNSIMGLMMLGAAKGNNIDIIVEYPDNDQEIAQTALNRLAGLVMDGFGED